MPVLRSQQFCHCLLPTHRMTEPKEWQKYSNPNFSFTHTAEKPQIGSKLNIHKETEKEHSNLTNEGKSLSSNPLGAVTKTHYQFINEIQSQSICIVCVELLQYCYNL